MARIQKLADNCCNLQGFIVYAGVGGGTGSGMGSYILEKLAEQYPKKSKMSFVVYPDCNSYSNSPIESYNALLA